MNSDLEREFYCTLKLVSGEEIFCLMMVDDTDDDPILVLQDPVVITYVTNRNHHHIKIEPWMKLTNDGIYFIRLSKVITMSEIHDVDLISLYKSFINSNSDDFNDEDENNQFDNERSVSKNMGFLGSVDETKKSLEKLFHLDLKDRKE